MTARTKASNLDELIKPVGQAMDCTVLVYTQINQRNTSFWLSGNRQTSMTIKV